MEFYDIGFVQSIKDFFNFFKFRKDIKKEIQRRDSKFNKFGLHLNWLGNLIYTQIDCTDEDYMNSGYDMDRMLQIKLSPIVSYLSTELGWGDYILPQVSNFVTEDNTPTLSFAIYFLYSGYNLTARKLLRSIIFTLLLLGGGIWAICHFLS